MRRIDNPGLWFLVSLPVGLMARRTGSARWLMRLGYAQERRGRLDLARDAYARAIAQPDSLPQWLHRLADVHERGEDWSAAERVWQQAVESNPDSVDHHVDLGRVRARHGDWTGAADALGRALELDPGRLDALEQLAAARAQLGDRRGAIEAYERVVRAGGASRGPGPRLGLARVLAEVGHWPAAREQLEANLALHPKHVASYRLLADVAYRMWEWNGYLEGPPDDVDQARFRPLASTRDESGTRESAHVEACRATERAAAADSRRSRWWETLGDVRHEAGYTGGALAAYEAATRSAHASDSPRIFKSLQRLEFGLERARHQAGLSEVEDPLFESSVTVEGSDDAAAQTPAERPAGLFTAALNFSGLRVRGFLLSKAVAYVELLLDDVPIRRLNVGGTEFFPAFNFSIPRRTLELFPKEGRLRLRADTGEDLLANGQGRAVALALPHGSGRLLDLVVEHGEKLDKKGEFSPSEEETRARQDGYLVLYDLVRDFFDEHVGKPVFLLYGTLLGLHRDGDLIPGDDDFDATYISEETDPLAVKEETKDIIVKLVQAGFTVRFNRRGRLFRVQRDDIGDDTLHLDLRPMFFKGGRVWVHNFASFPCDVSDFLPVQERTLRGTKVYVPRRPEVFLEGHYGPGWRVPDPGFVYHASDVDPAIPQMLDQLLITPREYESLKAYLEGEGARPGMGRLVSIGSEPLYPLDLTFL